MAISNTLVKATPDSNIVEYKVGLETIALSMDIIKNYLVNGGGTVTDAEAMMFLKQCQYQHLNPFLREAYLIKYGTRPAQMVVGKDTFIKRARHRPDFDGYKAGVIVQTKEGEIIEREGSFRAAGESLLGGWARVFIKGLSTPYYAAVAWGEYVGLKDGKPNSMWASKPTTMIRKVALSQALREAFPDDMGGLYEPEEINSVQMEDLPETPVENPHKAEAEQKVDQKVVEMERVEAEVVEDEDTVAQSLFG